MFLCLPLSSEFQASSPFLIILLPLSPWCLNVITSHCFSPENFYFSTSEKFFVVEFERQWPLNTFDYCKGIPISTNICVCSKRRIWPFRLFLRLTLATLRAVIFSKCCSLLTLSRRKRWLLREPPILDVHKRTCALFTLTKNKKKKKRWEAVFFLSLEPLCATLGCLAQPHKNKRKKKVQKQTLNF